VANKKKGLPLTQLLQHIFVESLYFVSSIKKKGEINSTT
jgi:hypothetical protein